MIRKGSSTSVLTRVLIRDSATGAGKTGLTYATAGLVISTIADNEATAVTYTAGSTIESIATLGAFVAPTATKCRFREVDGTNLPGVYELQIADARWAVANSKALIIQVVGTGIVSAPKEVQLVAIDLYDATDLGLSNLDAAVSSRSTFAGGAVASVTGNVGGNVSGSVGSVTSGVTVMTNNDKTGYALSGAGIQAIWDALASALTTAGSVGKLLTDNVTASISSVKSVTDRFLFDGNSFVKSSLSSILGTALTEGVAGRLSAAFKKFFDVPTPASTMDHLTLVDAVTNDVGITQGGADKVWSSATRTLTSFGTLVADAATAVWAAGARTLTAFGFTVSTNANATEVAIKAKTDNLPADPATASGVAALGAPMQASAHPTVGGYDAGQSPATLVLEAVASAHNTAGTIGQKINTTASGGGASAEEIWTYIDRELTNPAVSTYVGPISAAGSVAIRRGYAYKLAYGNQIQFSSSGWPDLNGIATELVDITSGGHVIAIGSLTVVGGDQVLTFEIDDVASAALMPGWAGRQYLVRAALDASNAIELAIGNLMIL